MTSYYKILAIWILTCGMTLFILFLPDVLLKFHLRLSRKQRLLEILLVQKSV